MSNQRPCDACGGTGHEYRDVREYGHAYRMRRAVRSTCPACSGRGWHSDAHECQCQEHDCPVRVSCDGICSVSGALHLCPSCFSKWHSPGKFAVLGRAVVGTL